MFDALRGKRIAWLVPGIEPGSGGLQTIFRHVEFTKSLGSINDIHVIPNGIRLSRQAALDILRSDYDCVPNELYPIVQLNPSYDAVIATMWTTVKFAACSDIQYKFYFIQDYEPWFYPMGNDYIEAEMTYAQPLYPITIGSWLLKKIESAESPAGHATSFCADRAIYKRLDSINRERAICAIFQPEKMRRCPRLLLDALEIVHKCDPSIEIYTFGSNHIDARLNGFAHQLGLLSKKKCNELYNSCLVGVSISASNPSRIPFEMMATGLPVIDLYRQNNLFDLPNDATLLAVPTPDALASAILYLVNHDDEVSRRSQAAVDYMASRNIDVELKQFASSLENGFLGTAVREPSDVCRSYTTPPFISTDETRSVFEEILSEQIDFQVQTQISDLEQTEHAASTSFFSVLKRLLRRTLSHLR